MTIEQLEEIQSLLDKRQRLNRAIRAFYNCLKITIDVPCGYDTLQFPKNSSDKEVKELFDIIVIVSINHLSEERDKVSEQLEKLGLEE